MIVPSFVSGPPAIVAAALEIAVKAAILCLAVWIAHVLAGRNRLLLRSVLWHLCLVGLVLLPVTVVAFPRWHVAMQWAETSIEINGRHSAELEGHTWLGDSDDGDVQPGIDDIDLPGLTAAAVLPEQAVGPRRLGQADDTGAARPISSATSHSFGKFASSAAIAVYFLTLAMILTRLAASLIAVTRLRYESNAVDNTAWAEALRHWHSQFALRRRVELLQSDRIGVPIVVGWRNPAILLPTGLAESYDRQAIDAVLLHELTHVGRGDYAWNLLLRIVGAIYWPHPGAWLACRMVRLVREEVCDAVCVYWMADARAYCGILVDVAAGLMERPEAALGMAMTHSSRLSRRLARVGQSAGSARGLLGRPARLTIAVCVVGSVSLLGTLQFVGRVSAEGRTLPQSSASPVSHAASARTADEPGSQHDVLALADEPVADRAELKTQNDALRSPDKSQPQRVTTIKVKRGKLEKVTVQPATLEAAGQVSIYARTSGIVSKTLVDIGDPIKARDVLAELDLPDAGIDVAEKEAVREQAEAVQEQAKAVLDAARAGVDAQEAHVAAARAESEKAASTEKFRKIQYERMKTLFEQKSVEERLLDEKEEQYKAAVAASKSEAAKIQTTAADVVKAKIDLRVAEAALKLAKVRTAVAVANLARSKAQNGEDFRLIRSPIDGVVIEKNTNTGVLVNRGENQPLFRIAAAGLITAVVHLPERDALTAQRGDPATLEFDALNNRPATAGKISRLAYGLDRVRRTLRAEITLSNADGRLKPGMYGKARIVTGEIADVLSIPKSALYNVKGETAACFRAVDGRAAATTVKLGYDNGEQVEIVEGLAEGDVVVVDSSTVKQNGDPASEDAP